MVCVIIIRHFNIAMAGIYTNHKFPHYWGATGIPSLVKSTVEYTFPSAFHSSYYKTHIKMLQTCVNAYMSSVSIIRKCHVLACTG